MPHYYLFVNAHITVFIYNFLAPCLQHTVFIHSERSNYTQPPVSSYILNLHYFAFIVIKLVETALYLKHARLTYDHLPKAFYIQCLSSNL